MRLGLALVPLAVLAAGNAYMASVTAVWETSSIATDQRPVTDQAADGIDPPGVIG